MGLYIFVLGLFVNVSFVPEVLDSEKQSFVTGKKKKKNPFHGNKKSNSIQYQ